MPKPLLMPQHSYWLLIPNNRSSRVLLSLRFDPFIVTVYLRRGRFGGMTRRDWRIFLLSWLIGNAWWSIVVFTGLSAVQWLWNWANAI